MNTSNYKPQPLDTSAIQLPREMEELAERLSRNTHENWARRRMADGWRWGPARDDARKLHPCLIPYEELPDSEKAYDRITAMETVKALLALGFCITRK